MRRILAIVLLMLLPLQTSWSAVASYCAHETQADASHLGHHEHQHHADASLDADTGAAGDAAGVQAPGTIDVDCGHCHGHGTGMLMLPDDLPGDLSTSPPNAGADAVQGAYAPTRPERPQWVRLA